ncbi:hypothetical protein ACXET9_07190 [Brachybacterium sp. DNPG3]
MSRHRPGARVVLRRGRVAHIVANAAADADARFTLCGVPVLMDDRAAVDTDPTCSTCYGRPAKSRPRLRRNR